MPFLGVGCATVIQAPSVAGAGQEVISAKAAETVWAEVLSRWVDSRGRVDFKNLGKNPAPLYRYLSYVAQTSPEKLPEEFGAKANRLTFYLNSYNALAMYGIIAHRFPDDFHSFTDRARFFKFTRFVIGGEEISLYDYENDIIRPLGDPRVHFALNCMVKACPRLPQTPFYAADLNDTLDALTREFVNDPRHVQVIKSIGLVRLSEIFDFYEEDFVNSENAASLISYINRYRDEPIDKNLKVEFIAYDWTVNYQ